MCHVCGKASYIRPKMDVNLPLFEIDVNPDVIIGFCMDCGAPISVKDMCSIIEINLEKLEKICAKEELVK